METNDSDINRQVKMICEYRRYLQRMYGRIVTHDEAARMWSKGYAEKYRLLHPYIVNRLETVVPDAWKKSETD